jgi:thymidylate kinase
VCLIGIDGSGKSTLARGVGDKLMKEGMTVRLIHMYHEPILLKPAKLIAQALFLRGARAHKNYTRYSQQKKDASQHYPWLSALYRQLWLLDYDFQVFFLLTLPGWFSPSNYFILDRYIFDTLLNISISLGWSEAKAMAATHKWLRQHPKPTPLFIIDLPEEIAMQRKTDVPSIEYLKERRRRYLNISKEFGAVLLDGQTSPEKLVDMVASKIKKIGK